MSYWVMDWILDEDITDVAQVGTALSSKEGLARLASRASIAAQQAPQTYKDLSGRKILASTGLDLSGVVSCDHPSCLIATVDTLISRSWLFFDKIIVVGFEPDEFMYDFNSNQKQKAVRRFTGHAEVALYILNSGLYEIFEFRRPGNYCTDHLDEHAAEAGLSIPASLMSKTLAEELERNGKLSLRETPQGLQYQLAHPALEFIKVGSVGKRGNKKEIKRRAARDEANVIVARLTTGVWRAREARASLGQAALKNMQTLPIRGVGAQPTSDVAFNLQLPQLSKIGPAEAIQLREEAHEEFEAFRGALVKTIEERTKAMPDASASEIGDAIIADILRPELARLDKRLEKSQSAMRKREAAALVVSGALTTVGLVAFAPLTVPGLILAAGGTVANFNEFLKDRKEVELSDLYFLWRAERMHRS